MGEIKAAREIPGSEKHKTIGALMGVVEAVYTSGDGGVGYQQLLVSIQLS